MCQGTLVFLCSYIFESGKGLGIAKQVASDHHFGGAGRLKTCWLKFSSGKCKGGGSVPPQQHCSCLLSGHLLGWGWPKQQGLSNSRVSVQGVLVRKTYRKGSQYTQTRGSWVKEYWVILWLQVTSDMWPRTLIFGLVINHQASSNRNP